MSRTDGGLRAIMHKHLKPFGHCVAIETGLIASGVPDSNYCINGHELWIESKHTSAWAVKVRPAQVSWAEQRVRHGGKVYCAVRRNGSTKAGAYDELWLCTHGALRWLLGGGTLQDIDAELVLGYWPGGPTEWPWRTVAHILTAGAVAQHVGIRT